MAIRGITGALLAGPIEAPDLTPLPFQEIVAFQELQDQRREAAMEDISNLQTNLDVMGSIPGTEEIGKYITKPYEDKLEQIYNKYDGNLSRMGPEVQALEFDFRTRMTDDVKSYAESVLGYQEQIKRLQDGVVKGTYDPSTAKALLNKQTVGYADALNNYNAGVGPRPSSAIFNRTPFERPDALTDVLKIADKIKPDQLSRYGLIELKGKDPITGQPLYSNTKGVQTIKYSLPEARKIAAYNFLSSQDNYQNWAAEQVELGLKGFAYEPGKNPVESAVKNMMSIRGLTFDDKDDAAVTEIRNNINSQIERLESQGCKRDQAQRIVENASHKELQVSNVLKELASGAGIGAFRQESITNVDAESKGGGSGILKGFNIGTSSDVLIGKFSLADDVENLNQQTNNISDLQNRMVASTDSLERAGLETELLKLKDQVSTSHESIMEKREDQINQSRKNRTFNPQDNYLDDQAKELFETNYKTLISQAKARIEAGSNEDVSGAAKNPKIFLQRALALSTIPGVDLRFPLASAKSALKKVTFDQYPYLKKYFTDEDGNVDENFELYQPLASLIANIGAQEETILSYEKSFDYFTGKDFQETATDRFVNGGAEYTEFYDDAGIGDELRKAVNEGKEVKIFPTAGMIQGEPAYYVQRGNNRKQDVFVKGADKNSIKEYLSMGEELYSKGSAAEPTTNAIEVTRIGQQIISNAYILSPIQKTGIETIGTEIEDAEGNPYVQKEFLPNLEIRRTDFDDGTREYSIYQDGKLLKNKLLGIEYRSASLEDLAFTVFPYLAIDNAGTGTPVIGAARLLALQNIKQ